MGKSMNKCFLLGNVGKDPEIKATTNGTIVANFSLATADRARGADGQWNEITIWHNCVAFQKTAEIVRDYVKKGSQVLVEGKINNRSWEDKETGKKNYRTEIVVNELTLLGGKGGSDTSASRESGVSRFDNYTAPESEDIPF